MEDEGSRPGQDPVADEAALADFLRRRRAGIQARSRRLRERMRQLADHRPGGSAPHSAERAREHADRAEQAAHDAYRHAAESHGEAAAVHLRVADAFDRLGLSDRAGDHRAAAAADRADAAADHAAAVDADPDV